MIVYSYKGDYKGQKDLLFKKSWDDYSQGKNLPSIIRDRNGKPFFKDANYYFSISHSQEYWVCVFSKQNLGIDIQYRKFSGKELSIAKRFFSEEEALTVKNEGETYFYKLWVRREALGKYLGSGFFLPEEIGDFPIIQEFTIEDEYQGAIALEKDEKIWIKAIK